MKIRTATIEDLAAIAKVEWICFPEGEAAKEDAFKDRLIFYPNHFWLLEDGSILVGFVNGMVTDKPNLSDEMYKNADLHKEDGAWQMIFGVNTIPEYRNQGCAARILNHVIAEAKIQKRLGLVLTCKDKLLSYYEKFGFKNEGVSDSDHGGAKWYQMRLTF